LKPDKNGGNRTDLGCFWGCRLYYELSRNHIGLGSVMIPDSDRWLQLEVTAFVFYQQILLFGCPLYRISHRVYYTHKVERGTTKEREDFKMNIYENGYN